MNKKFWKDKQVLITGHTGFKGSWLSLILNKLGAHVIGLSNSIPTNPNMYELTNIQSKIISIDGDVRNYQLIEDVVRDYKPTIIFHMAAQSLVRKSYENPMETFTTNIMGTVNIFDSVRLTNHSCVIINVTSDKCYENISSINAFKETDRLGGYDPYSCSKACSELITSSMRNSFFKSSNIALASVRAGNVIGGGDWSDDRLIPDIVRNVLNKKKLQIRNPVAIRPWQHVLEPLCGYLLLSEKLCLSKDEFSEAWNFGPDLESYKPVKWIVSEISKIWDKDIPILLPSNVQPYESAILKLDCTKAKQKLGWLPKMNLSQALQWTVDWYKTFENKGDVTQITEQQIDDFMEM